MQLYITSNQGLDKVMALIPVLKISQATISYFHEWPNLYARVRAVPF